MCRLKTRKAPDGLTHRSRWNSPSEELVGLMAALDDDAFDGWLSKRTGLAGLKV